MQMARFRISVLAFVVLGASAAHAETLTVSGWYAAEQRDVAMLQSLAVDRFDGEDGPGLASAIEYALGQGRDRDGAPYYTLRSRYGDVDAMVYGAMRVRVAFEDFKRKAKRCAADPQSTKCKDDEKVEIDLACRRRIISANADIKVTRLDDDALIYNRALPQRNQTETCEGEKLPPAVDDIVDDLVRTIAGQFAAQITPYGRTEKIRIRETRSGMTKDDANQMKALIALTKRDEAGACRGWADMEERGVNHPTLKFNLGLCAEASGMLDMALGYYEPLAASSRNAVDVREAIDRVERRMAGEADDRERSGVGSKP
jgi:hypothetical protein